MATQLETASPSKKPPTDAKIPFVLCSDRKGCTRCSPFWGSEYKLIAFLKAEWDKHLRDVQGVLVTRWGWLDVEAIRRGAQPLGTLNEFEAILEAARREVEE